MKKTALILFISVALHCSKQEIVELPITTSSEMARELYREAIKHMEVGDNIEKRAALDSAIKTDPNFALALEMNDAPDRTTRKNHQEKAKTQINNVTEQEKLILLIREAYRNNNMDDALAFGKELVDKNQNSYDAHNWLGIIQSDRNEIGEAIKSLNKAIKLNPDNFLAYNYLMGHHIPSGDRVMLPEDKRNTDKGLEYGDELIRIRPDAGFSYHFKANCYRQIGEFEKAIPLYEKSIEKRRGKSSEATALLVSGHNYMFSGDYKTARKRYAEAIETSKTKEGQFSLNNYLTWSYVFGGNYTGAIENIKKMENNLEQLGFKEEDILLRRATLNWQKFVFYAHNQMEKDANEALASSISFSEKRAKTLRDPIIDRSTKSSIAYNKAWSHTLFGRYGNAKLNLEELKTIQEKINNPTAMFGYNNLMGTVSLMEGKAKDALGFFEKGDPNDTYFLYFKALALKATGDGVGAKEILTDIANTNFSYWQLAIMKTRAKTLLENT
ncbi:MAG: tetratricopeptide repeat protein [Sphingomonadales bacterium]